MRARYVPLGFYNAVLTGTPQGSVRCPSTIRYIINYVDGADAGLRILHDVAYSVLMDCSHLLVDMRIVQHRRCLVEVLVHARRSIWSWRQVGQDVLIENFDNLRWLSTILTSTLFVCGKHANTIDFDLSM
jgi:hypothetical protein